MAWVAKAISLEVPRLTMFTHWWSKVVHLKNKGFVMNFLCPHKYIFLTINKDKKKYVYHQLDLTNNIDGYTRVSSIPIW